jgi:alanyl-tRNA synthetase
MAGTRRLYFDDPWLHAFEAEVLSVVDDDWVVLDASAFYPESGGQMADRGNLGDARVVDVQVDAAGVVRHRLEGALPQPGARVSGAVDTVRRRAHMALHTGQHMLSRALLDVAGAETVSSRLGESGCTIDVDKERLSEARLAEAEALVNSVVDDDVAVRALFPTPEQLASLPLRRAPKVSDGIRIIQVGDFDYTPCGGTHCTRSAQVGLVRITGVERYKGKQRVTFSAGPRARAELFAAAERVRALAQRFTCGPADIPAAIDALERSLADAQDQLSRARGRWLRAEAEELVARADADGHTRVIAVVEGADADALRTLAGRVTERPDRAALLAADVGDGLHVVCARGADSDVDCGALLKAARERVGGKGGGKAERAEGRLPAGTDWPSLCAELLA